VRDGQGLRDTFSFVPPYLRTEEGKGFGGLPWFSEYGFQQTRGFARSSCGWCSSTWDATACSATWPRHLALARTLADLVDARAGSSSAWRRSSCRSCASASCHPAGTAIPPPPMRSTSGSWSGPGRRARLLTNATVGGRFALRACVLHYGTSESDLELLVRAVREAGARLVRAG
jgi:hypothetical protein